MKSLCSITETILYPFYSHPTRFARDYWWFRTMLRVLRHWSLAQRSVDGWRLSRRVWCIFKLAVVWLQDLMAKKLSHFWTKKHDFQLIRCNLTFGSDAHPRRVIVPRYHLLLSFNRFFIDDSVIQTFTKSRFLKIKNCFGAKYLTSDMRKTFTKSRFWKTKL